MFNPHLYKLKAGDVFIYDSGLGPNTYVRLANRKVLSLLTFEEINIPENTEVKYLGILTTKRQEWKDD
jgi:hypothetical protein